MRFVLLALLVVVSCKKSEPAKSADPAAAPAAPAGSAAAAEPPAAAPAPEPAPPPSPPAEKSPNEAAIEATIAIFKAVTPITEKYRDGGDDCVKKGLPELEKVLDGMKAEIAVVEVVTKNPDNAKPYYEAFFKGDESPLSEAKSAALGPAIHCAKVHDRILEAFGIKLAAEPKKKKK